jgi:hypothetical protein
MPTRSSVENPVFVAIAIHLSPLLEQKNRTVRTSITPLVDLALILFGHS